MNAQGAELPGALRAALAPLGGALLFLAFPGIGLWPLILPALGTLFVLSVTASPRRAALDAGLFVFVFFALLLRWFAAAILDFSDLPAWLAVSAVLAAALVLAAQGAVLAALAARVTRRFGVGAGLGMAALGWCVFELLRYVIPVPFPWATLSAAGAHSPLFARVIALVGWFGVSALFALGAALLAACVFWPRRAPLALGGWGLLLAGVFALGSAGEPAAHVRVAVLQGSLPRDAHPVDQVRSYEALTREAAERGAKLVVWPESAVRVRIDQNPSYRMRVELLAEQLDVDILLGSITNAPGGGYHNSALLVRARRGLVSNAPKRILVPFGEYLPWRFVLGKAKALAAELGDFTAGTRPVVHPSGVGPVGALVCYEAVFPSVGGELADAGAQLLVNITNDSWFGWTSGPEQHFVHGRLRAAETGRPLLRAANSGISAIVDGDGTLLGRLELGERGVLVADVGIGRAQPPGLAVSRALAWACAILALALSGLAAIPKRAAAPALEACPQGAGAGEESDDA